MNECSRNEKASRCVGVSMLVSALLAGASPSARAVEVDAELLLLVDVTWSVSFSEFDTMMEEYAQAFESGAVLDSLQTGEHGSIAASVVFYSSRNRQSVGVGWMEISDEASAQDFADALRAAVVPFGAFRASVSNALDFAVPYFGDETGGTGNGFESDVQAITLTADGIDTGSRRTGGSRETTVQNARDAALSSGVDIINAVTIGTAGSVDDYFVDNVIGGAVGETQAGVVNAVNFAELDVVLEPAVVDQIASVVPEPGWLSLLGFAGWWCSRRKRNR